MIVIDTLKWKGRVFVDDDDRTNFLNLLGYSTTNQFGVSASRI
ncbi:MAG: hypothetical protein HW396_1289 [Candidatus Dadabacteria bacterium]|nr:hypothetical protein [Candidatus Dadabacteria bacterium]